MTMSEKPESEEFEEDDADEPVDADDASLESLIKDLELHKRRGARGGSEPAWRRLEKYLEQKRTQELLSDFDDYDIGEPTIAGGAPRKNARRKARR
jgi:hypothetical protein